jgi:general secretion pathway protein D
VFVYHVQNGRATDLAKVLNAAYGNATAASGPEDPDAPSLTDTTSHERTSPSQAGLPGGLVGGAGARSGFPAAPAASAAAQSSGSAGSGGEGTTITVDESNNAIVVFSTPRQYALITDALAKLDTPQLQVMIDASISEVTLNHALQYGIQWAFQAGNLGGALSQGQVTQEQVQTGGVTTTYPNGTTTTTPINTVTKNINPGPIQNFPGMSFLYRGTGWSAVLNALHTITDVTVLSAPKLMVLNNHTATIEVGDQVPISTGSAVSTLTAGAPIVNSVEYRDTGIILKITPRVNSGGLVLLDIAQEVSEVNSSASSSSQIASPTISERKIATSVAVQDGETVALGGLIKNEVQKGRSAIPLLDSIPVLGHLFGDTTGALLRTELVVLLTPRVIRAPVDAREVTKELRDKIHEAAPPPPPSADPKPGKRGKPAAQAG